MISLLEFSVLLIEERQTTRKIPKGQSESLIRRGTYNTEDTKGAIKILK
jgi:hypothetical protein